MCRCGARSRRGCLSTAGAGERRSAGRPTRAPRHSFASNSDGEDLRMPHRDPDDNRACERRRNRRLTAERVAQGLCTKCGKSPPEPDRRLCPSCGEKKRAAERTRYSRAKAEGKPYGGRDRRERRGRGRTRAKRLYRERRAAGTCTRCGERPPAQAAPLANLVATSGAPTSVTAGRLGGPVAGAASAGRPWTTVPPVAPAAPTSRRAEFRPSGRTPRAGSATLGAVHATSAPIAAPGLPARRGASRAPTAPGPARRSIGGCRPRRHDTRWSTPSPGW